MIPRYPSEGSEAERAIEEELFREQRRMLDKTLGINEDLYADEEDDE